MDKTTLSPDELRRYHRQIIIPEIGTEGQEKLRAARVLVIGAGGLGCPVLQYLTASGVGTIGIVDDDVVDETNLQRQILYTIEDIGKSKAETAAQKLSLHDPYVRLLVYNTRLTADNALEILSSYDVIVDGSDNFPTRYLVNDACVLLNKPLVFGSIYRFEGQVTVFNYLGGPTYRCLFPEMPPTDEIPACSEAGVIGVLPGIVGCIQANEAIKLITGIGETLNGKLLVFDSLLMNVNIYHFRRTQAAGMISSLTQYNNSCERNDKMEIDANELKERLERGENIQIIDVRESSEYESFNIGGTLIPLSAVSNNIDKISRDKMVVVHCHIGSRSKKAVKMLSRDHGFTNVFHLSGGIVSWLRQTGK